VKGSHIILPRCYKGDHAHILQNDDRRIVFMIPYLDRFTLIGTTDVGVTDTLPEISDFETEYLCRAVNRYLSVPIPPGDVVYKYAGVRPLYDDGSANPSSITRDYTLRVDTDGPPVVSVFGGKITTYRKLAEHVLDRLHPRFPAMHPAWTAAVKLPGGEFTSTFENFSEIELAEQYSWMPRRLRCALAYRHGARIHHIIRDAFGGELFQREIDYLIETEWAQTGADILYRRTKAGLLMQAPARDAVEHYVSNRVKTRKATVR
jgi:glycerol-3-phosphate dehydrogenase